VMRKHRLAERLLTDVIGLEWELVHAEACRWEHVMSEQVERRLLALLDHPTLSPYGNPIPGLDELGEDYTVEDFMEGLEPLDKILPEGGEQISVTVRRIGEDLQTDEQIMGALRRVDARPGKIVKAARGPEGVLIGSGGEVVEIDLESAAHVFVQRQ
jgi:DtxR family transcriptional regulator, Mn-dependent transcriptional regulator